MTNYARSPQDRPWIRDLNIGDRLTEEQVRSIQSVRLDEYGYRFRSTFDGTYVLEKAPAKPQGWNLFDFDNTGLLHIEKDDAAHTFESDADAVEHVHLLAARGDHQALHAIQLHDLNQPKIDALRRKPVTTKGEGP
jgi:hypothetical protein